jgi:malyl-CoA/(S)-citramalyl-CoA lyase
MGNYDTVTGASQGPRQHWDYALARIANACRAHGLRPIDAPFTKYSDLAGLRTSAERAASLGFEGKWAIHPSQLAICNEVFSPTVSQIEWAERTLDAMGDAVAMGAGAIGRNGILLDMAHVRLAKIILERAAAFESMAG